MIATTDLPPTEAPHPEQSWHRRLLIVITHWANCWSPFAAAAFGALFCVALASLAQVWAYPVPRSLLSTIAMNSSQLAVYWAGYAVGDRYIRAWRQSITDGPSFVPYLYWTALGTLGYGHYILLPKLVLAAGKLATCAQSVGAGLCNADVSKLTPEIVEAMKSFLP